MKLPPDTCRSTLRHDSALTLIELLVILFIVVIFAVLLFPAISHSRRPRGISCMNNLRQVGIGFYWWANDGNDGKFPMEISATHQGTKDYAASGSASVHFQTVYNYFKNPGIFVCPCDPARWPATNAALPFSNHNLSYFLNVDAQTNQPAAVFLGDRNLALDRVPLSRGLAQITNFNTLGWTTNLHSSRGVILFAEGHGRVVDNKATPGVFRQGETTSYRLVIP